MFLFLLTFGRFHTRTQKEKRKKQNEEKKKKKLNEENITI